jgi:hypothetical protein
MAFNSKLSELSSTSVLNTEQLLADYINESFPDLDLTPGSVQRDIIVNLYAALEQRIRDELEASLKSNSLLEITKDPTVADDAQVDRVLSNYNITRSNGAKASGYVRVTISSDSTTLIPEGTKMTLDSLEFKVSASVRAISSTETLLQTGDIALVKGTGGVYFVNVPVVAAEVGAKYNVKEGSKASNMTPKVSKVVSVEAAQTLLGGKDAETNAELVTKLQQGVLGKILGGRAHIEAKLKDEFPYVISVGATGFGDPEMTRDVIQTDSAATHRGGTVDIHARTAHYPLVETISVVADEVPSTDYYEFTLTREQCNGLYAVAQVNLPTSANSGTLCIVEYDRTVDLPTSGPVPSIVTGLDLGFSTYQKVRIRVNDPATSALISSSVEYSVKLLKLPYIDVLQDYVTYGENRSVAADMVVKAAVPIFCGCNIKVVKPKAAPDIDTLEIQLAVANAVNGVPFGKPIPVSLIAHTVHSYLPENAFIDFPIKLHGNLYYPDKPAFADIDNTGYSFGDENYDTGAPDVLQLRTSDTLRPPNHPNRGVSDKTVAFFLNPYAIDIVVAEV